MMTAFWNPRISFGGPGKGGGGGSGSEGGGGSGGGKGKKNQAPTIADITFHFDRVTNTAPAGQSILLAYEVPAA